MVVTADRNRKRTAGLIMAAAGFVLILANALDYLFGWEANLVPLFIIGIMLVVVGTSLSARK